MTAWGTFLENVVASSAAETVAASNVVTAALVESQAEFWRSSFGG